MSRAIVNASDAGSDFEHWLELPEFVALEDHPITGGFGRRYYPAAFETKRRDVSFAVVEDGKPILIVPCALGEGVLDWYGTPIEMFPAASLKRELQETVADMALRQLDALIQAHQLTSTMVRDRATGGLLSPLSEACIGRGWRLDVALEACCDLTSGEAGLRKALRKSYRSLVNWGRNNLRMTYVNAANPDAGAFAAYRAFHRTVAGRSTRPEESWTIMFDWITRSGGELALGHLSTGELVAGTLCLDGTSKTYYSSGVYDRARFDKPMAHFPLYDAILRAGGRGLRIFDLGELPQIGTVDEKEYAIGYFKRGFAASIALGLRLRWKRAGA